MEILLLFFLVWLPCSILVGRLASKRGRSGMGWGFLWLLLSPVICLLALLVLPDAKYPTAMPATSAPPQAMTTDIHPRNRRA